MEYLKGNLVQVGTALKEITNGLITHNGLKDIKTYSNICECRDGYYIPIDISIRQYLSMASLALICEDVQIEVKDENE